MDENDTYAADMIRWGQHREPEEYSDVAAKVDYYADWVHRRLPPEERDAIKAAMLARIAELGPLEAEPVSPFRKAFNAEKAKEAADEAYARGPRAWGSFRD